MTDRSFARDLSAKYLAKDDPTGWFEELYQEAEAHPEVLSWADKRPNPHLVSWCEKKMVFGEGKSALVIGCGYGDDAEWLRMRGFEVTAFDISSTAITAARRRFPFSKVHYRVQNILEIPGQWARSFDFVFEAYTLQVLKGEYRARAFRNIASTARHCLLLVTRGRSEDEEEGKMPWPLTESELSQFLELQQELIQVSSEDFYDDEVPPVRRFRLEYRKK